MKNASEARKASIRAAREQENSQRTRTTRLSAVSTELVEVKHKLADAELANEENEKQINHLQKSLSSSSLALSLLSQSETELSVTRKAFEEAEQNLDKEKKRATHFMKKTRAAIASTCRLKKSKKKEEESAHTARGNLEEELSELMERFEEVGNELHDVAEENSSLENRLSAKELELDRAYQQIEKQRVEFEHTLAAFTRELEKLKQEICGLQYIVERLKIEEDELMGINEDLTEQLDEYKAERKRTELRISRLEEAKHKLEEYRNFVQETLEMFDKKGAYAPRIRGIVRFMIARACPLKNVGKILNNIYQILLKPLLNPLKRPDQIKLDQRTAKRIAVEGLVAARLQQFLELIRTVGKTPFMYN